MPTFDVDAAVREVLDDDPIVLRFGGKDRHLRPTIPLAYELSYQRQFEAATTLSTVGDLTIGWVRGLLVDEADRAEWDAITSDPDNAVSARMVNELRDWIVAEYAARPTSRSAGSAGGPRPTGQPSSSTHEAAA